nr:hypothetical protein [Tanacetum cinerariifolium]
MWLIFSSSCRLLKRKKKGSKALKRNLSSRLLQMLMKKLNGSTEVPKEENCYDHDILNMLTHEVKVPSKSKSSCLSNNVKKIEENHRNSQIHKNQKYMSSECNNITLAIRNSKSEIVCVMCKQCLVTANHDVCVLNYVNDMNSRAYNQSSNVLIRENQNKHKANAKKSKELGSKGSLASSWPSKPRTCLRWIPTGRIFAMCGKLTASINTEIKFKKSMCNNASTSNPSKPSSKGFLNSASLLGRDLHGNTQRPTNCCFSRSYKAVKNRLDGSTGELNVAFCLGLRFTLEALRFVSEDLAFCLRRSCVLSSEDLASCLQEILHFVFKDLAFCLGSTAFCLQRSCVLP